MAEIEMAEFVYEQAVKLLVDSLLNEKCDCGNPILTCEEITPKDEDHTELVNPVYDPVHFLYRCPKCGEGYSFELTIDDPGRMQLAYASVDEGWKRALKEKGESYRKLDPNIRRWKANQIKEEWDAKYRKR